MKTQQKSVHKKLIRVLAAVLLLLAILAGVFFWYVSDYYRAEDVALEVLAQNDGIVTQDNLTILSPSYQSNTAIIFYPGCQGRNGSLSAVAQSDSSDRNYLHSGGYAVSHGNF